MIEIKKLGIITDSDIEKIEPVDNGLAIHEFSADNLTDDVKGKILKRLNISDFDNAYLILYINIVFEDTATAFENGISLSLIFDNNKDFLLYDDFFINDEELLELKKQIIIPHIMQMRQVLAE